VEVMRLRVRHEAMSGVPLAPHRPVPGGRSGILAG